ncbi:unnamed protein product, partial [Hapterophycus canaliculatus]
VKPLQQFVDFARMSRRGSNAVASRASGTFCCSGDQRSASAPVPILVSFCFLSVMRALVLCMYRCFEAADYACLHIRNRTWARMVTSPSAGKSAIRGAYKCHFPTVKLHFFT